MEWISMSEKTPDKNGIYWAYPTKDTRGYCAMYWNGNTFSRGGRVQPLHKEGANESIYFPSKVTHWHEMRLEEPEPPKD
jgi:hypothetical protein